MSVIAVKGIPSKFNLNDVVKNVGKLIAGPFEPLNFGPGRQNTKICYLRLSERLNPVQIVERISSTRIGPKRLTFTAYIPRNISDLKLSEKRKKIPMKLREKLKIPEFELPHEVITNTHHELFLEIQYKYPGLYNLSRKTSHKLLDEIARVIGDRLSHIMDTNPETRDSSFQLSKCYRRMHPHFGDFQLILSTLHRLQDAAGAPRTQLQENELLRATNLPLMVDNVPLERVKASCNKYSERVAVALAAHAARLEAAPAPGDGAEQRARKRVRAELKRMLPYIPAALKQVITTHFVPAEQQFRRIRIYGEPFLPNRDALAPFTRRYTAAAARVVRSRRMYNLLMFRVPAHAYEQLRAMDATVINGAKLTIRSDIPVHPVSDALRSELAVRFGGAQVAPPRDDDDDEEDDAEEDQQ